MTARGGAPAHRAQAGLVLLHGRGGSAREMLVMAEMLALPDVAAIAPEAPGLSWWPISFLAPMSQLQPWLDQALSAVASAVAELEREGLPSAAISICGFSQGACLALEYAARRGAGLSGLFAFSGGMLGTSDAPGAPERVLYGHRPKRFDYDGRLDGLMVEMSCHEIDPHIPLARFKESRDVLRNLGASVTARTYPGEGHAIMEADRAGIRGHLNRARL